MLILFRSLQHISSVLKYLLCGRLFISRMEPLEEIKWTARAQSPRLLSPSPLLRLPTCLLYHSQHTGDFMSLWMIISFMPACSPNCKFHRGSSLSVALTLWLQSLAQGLYVACAQSWLTLCGPMDGSPPGSPAHGILQARTLEWAAMPSSRGSPPPRGWTHVSRIAGGFLTTSAAWKALCMWWVPSK